MGIHEDYRDRLATWSDIQDHLPFLHEAALSYPACQVIELGVRGGRSTSALLSAAERVGGHLWSCDINSPQVPPAWRESPHWTFTLGRSLGRSVLAAMPAQADVVLIDSSHEFDQTLAELQEYVPRVRPGGVVLLHDTQFLPPSTSLPEPGGPVTEAIHAFSVQTGRTWENRHSKPGWYGLGVIRV